jgi:hypothetical protein
LLFFLSFLRSRSLQFVSWLFLQPHGVSCSRSQSLHVYISMSISASISIYQVYISLS